MTYAIKNGVWTTVATGITSTATSLTVATGDGAKFGSPSTTNPVRCIVVDTSTTPETIKEYVDVTAVATDTLTIIREVEESTRFPKVALTAGWYVAPVITAAVIGALPVSNTETGQNVTASTSTTPINVTTGTVVNVALNANTTVSFTSAPAFPWGLLIVFTQDATGGRTVAFSGISGSSPTIGSAANAVTGVSVTRDNAGNIYAAVAFTA